MKSGDQLPGIIIRHQSGFYTVQTKAATVTCALRGRLKRGRHVGDIASIGDRVLVSLLPDGSGRIELVEPRLKALVRLDPRPQGLYQQVILANPDQAVFVFACANPAPHLRMLDRFLVVAGRQDIPAVIIANKIDLAGKVKAQELFEVYARIGYPVLYTSVVTGEGVEALHNLLIGKISALAGPSGAGKSSLLNAIQPGLGLEVREVSAFVHKGRHTTTVRQLIPLDEGGYVADTPGLRSLALWDTSPEELDGFFPEIAPLVSQCQFNNCSHKTEPGCAVRSAVEAGSVSPQRYDSYLRMRVGEE
jgi:ribosome biogenesis GTPase